MNLYLTTNLICISVVGMERYKIYSQNPTLIWLKFKLWLQDPRFSYRMSCKALQMVMYYIKLDIPYKLYRVLQLYCFVNEGCLIVILFMTLFMTCLVRWFLPFEENFTSKKYIPTSILTCKCKTLSLMPECMLYTPHYKQ